MAISLSDNIGTLAPKILDSRYGPYTSVTHANQSISVLNRVVGLTVGVLSGTTTFDGGRYTGATEGIYEYWYYTGITNNDLVFKSVVSSSFATTASYSLSSSFATTASYALFAANGGGGGGFVYATIDDQLDNFSRAYLNGNTPTKIITGSINEPLTYTGEFQLFEIINVSRQLSITLSTYGDVNMTSSININEDTDLSPGTYFSAPSGSYFSSITFGTTVGNQSIKVYQKVIQPPLLDDGLYTSSSVIIGKNLYIYDSLEVFNGITGSVQGTASHALTASYALNAESQGSGFPFSGDAVITGSIVSGNEVFPIKNNKVNYHQTSSISSAVISLEPKSNLVDEPYIINSEFFDWAVLPSEIFVGSEFRILISNGIFGGDYLIGTRVFYTGSTDVFGVTNFRYVGDVISWYSYYNNSIDSNVTEITVKSVTATVLIPTENPPFTSIDAFRFYPSSGGGIINLDGYVTVSKGLNVTGLTNLSTVNVSEDVNIEGTISASAYRGDGYGLSGIITNPMFEELVVNNDITATGSLNSDGANRLNLGNTNFSAKTINLGQIETVLAVRTVTSKPDQNTITLIRNIDNETRTHTQINFNGRYWKYFGASDEYDALLDEGNNYLRFISSVSSSTVPPDVTFNRIINLQFHTQPTGSNTAKGFSTNYNGNTYFNITGSISASSYYGDGSNLTNLYTTPVIFSQQTSSYTISLSDLGKMVELSGSNPIEVIIPPNSQTQFPIGSQITFIGLGNQLNTFVTGSGVTILSVADKKNLFGQYSVATCVKKSTDTWYLFGDIN
jgi:hypothetical protein